ncbi:MAG TPA: 3-dehydroquinate synthase [Burkholderiaceae bacterium]|nr:3-dehydroquinate synthase [Burkholderiaceae bacterium]
MVDVPVALAGRQYVIHVGPGLLDQLGERVAALRPTSIVVVTDPTVAALYLERAVRSLQPVARTEHFVLPASEAAKDLAAAAKVVDALVAARADRRSLLVALGGGVVGDIAGFAAAIFMRGIRFVQVPTTLLAQVDSSVGGKTGVNHAAGKNLIGAFHQPGMVLADTSLLHSLPAREVSAGLAEVVKHGLLADADYFAQVEGLMPRLLECDDAALGPVVARSCAIKAGVVGRDERESGERALLNLGHTFGHAIEAMSGYGRWLHGEAVGCGLCLAADLSRRMDLIDSGDLQRIEHAVASARLPVRIPGFERGRAIEQMRGDKKSEGGRMRFIVLERIGRAAQRLVPDAVLDATLVAGGYV